MFHTRILQETTKTMVTGSVHVITLIGMSLGICCAPLRVRNRSPAFVISKPTNRGRPAWVILGCPMDSPYKLMWLW